MLAVLWSALVYECKYIYIYIYMYVWIYTYMGMWWALFRCWVWPLLQTCLGLFEWLPSSCSTVISGVQHIICQYHFICFVSPCVCVCVCVRERERERENVFLVICVCTRSPVDMGMSMCTDGRPWFLPLRKEHRVNNRSCVCERKSPFHHRLSCSTPSPLFLWKAYKDATCCKSNYSSVTIHAHI